MVESLRPSRIEESRKEMATKEESEGGGLQQLADNIKEDGKKHKRWFPLESNPEVMTTYCAGLGLNVEKTQFIDVLSTDDWALDMVPKPVLGVLMVFPIKEVSEAHRAEEKARIESEGQTVSDNLWYTKQFVGNACGTVGLLHAIANARASPCVELAGDKFLSQFFSKTAKMNPHDAGVALEEDEVLEESHVAAASSGQSAVTQDVNSHFVAFSHVDGALYELDGRKASPVNHGPCTADTLLEESIKVVKAFMARDPDEIGFTMVALCGIE